LQQDNRFQVTLLRSFLVFLCFWTAVVLQKADGATPAPLPPLQLVLQRVMQTSADENAEYHIFNQHYFYTRDKVTEFFDGAGNLKGREEKQSTNNPAPRLAPARPHPAPRVVKKQSPPAQPNVHGVALGKKEDLLNPDIIKRFKFAIVGRDTVNGRPALVVDFAPVSDNLPVFNIKDRVINSVAGRAWVDEQDFTLEKVDLHLTRKLSVLDGLVGSISKFTFSFERERTSDGYWFTRDMSWHLEAREATLQRIVDHREEVSDLQKYLEAR
jgi:hypothetical protein